MSRLPFERLQKALGLIYQDKIHLNDEPRYVTYRHHGLDYALFDRNGHPSIFQLMKSAIHIRNIGIFSSLNDKGDTLVDWVELQAKIGCTFFVAATDFQISRDMYKYFIPKGPLDVKVSLGHVGNGSVTIVLELFLLGSQEAILRQRKKVVIVDPHTRKPMPIPEWYKKRFAGKGVMEGMHFRVERFERPGKTFFRRSEILWSDTDANNHTNYASYSRLAMDAVHSCLFIRSKSKTSKSPNVLADGHRNITKSVQEPVNLSASNSVVSECSRSSSTGQFWGGDISALGGLTERQVAQGLKRVEVVYLQECVEGDPVETHVWEENGVSGRVKCSVEGAEGRTLCQLTLEYFEPLSEL